MLLDAKNFLGDIDSITLNETSTNVSDHLAGYICHKKLKLYDECCDQLLLSGEPNSAYIDTFHGRSEKSFDEDDVTWHCYKGLLSA